MESSGEGCSNLTSSTLPSLALPAVVRGVCASPLARCAPLGLLRVLRVEHLRFQKNGCSKSAESTNS